MRGLAALAPKFDAQNFVTDKAKVIHAILTVLVAQTRPSPIDAQIAE